jgi:YegS/Rv2252/BmrU family lipid kinase
MDTALVIHNPSAGSGRRGRARRLDGVRRALEHRGVVSDLVETRVPGDATGFGRRAGTEGYAFVLVCGGDGTLNEVVNGLVGTPGARTVALGVLPAGTANILARELGVPRDLEQAAACITAGTARRIALGLAIPVDAPDRRRYFVCVAGAGPDGEIVHSIDLALKKRVGILAYWWGAARVTCSYGFPRFRVTANAHQVDASFVTVGRTRRYGGPFMLTPDARLDEDAFDVVALVTRRRAAYLGHLPAAWRGSLRGRGIHRWKTTNVTCAPLGDRPVHAQVDGEPIGPLPVEFSIVPDALTIVTPAASVQSTA